MTSSVESHLPRLDAAVAIADAVLEQKTFAASLFDACARVRPKDAAFAATPMGKEKTRASPAGETARDLGFLVDHDAAANTYVTMAGRDHRHPGSSSDRTSIPSGMEAISTARRG